MVNDLKATTEAPITHQDGDYRHIRIGQKEMEEDMTGRRKDDEDLKITVRIRHGERTPMWDHFWRCIFLDLPFTEQDPSEKEKQETEERET
jgi:hypothetical protein